MWLDLSFKVLVGNTEYLEVLVVLVGYVEPRSTSCNVACLSAVCV